MYFRANVTTQHLAMDASILKATSEPYKPGEQTDLLGQNNKDRRIRKTTADEMEPASEILLKLMILLFKLPIAEMR